MIFKASILSVAFLTLPTYAQSASVLCAAESFVSRVMTDENPIAIDADGALVASLTSVPEFYLNLRIWDFTDPDMPVIASTTEIVAGFFGGSVYLSLSGNRAAFGSRSNNEVVLADLTDPNNPLLGSSILISANSVQVVGNRLYIVSDKLVSIYDISDINAPALLGSTPGAFAWALDVVDDKMYVAGAGSELQIFDISNPISVT